MGKLGRLAHRLFQSRRRAASDSDSYANPLCQSLLQIQDRPLLAFSNEYLIPFHINFEAVPRDRPSDAYIVTDSNRREFVELRFRNDVLCPEIREIWSLDGRRRIAFSCRKRWSKDWTLYLPSGAALCQLTATSGGFAADIHSLKEVISVQMHCTCGGPCFILHRGDNHHAGRTIALVMPRPEKSGFMIVVAPFVDVLLIIAISSCVWKMV